MVLLVNDTVFFADDTTWLVVWDFDESLSNCNSDTRVPELLSPELNSRGSTSRDLPCSRSRSRSRSRDRSSNVPKAVMEAIASLKPEEREYINGLLKRKDTREELLGWFGDFSKNGTMPCKTDLVDFGFGLEHRKGMTEKDIREACRKMEYYPENLEAVELGYKKGATQYIVSDANEVYIQEFVAHHRIQGISEIITNPSKFDENGRLRVERYVKASKPHNCKVGTCSENMCKGAIMRDRVLPTIDDQLKEKTNAKLELASRRRIIYVGDGGGDFCGTLQLREGDLVFARSGGRYSLHKKLNDPKYPNTKATIKLWSDGKELLANFQEAYGTL